MFSVCHHIVEKGCLTNVLNSCRNKILWALSVLIDSWYMWLTQNIPDRFQKNCRYECLVDRSTVKKKRATSTFEMIHNSVSNLVRVSKKFDI